MEVGGGERWARAGGLLCSSMAGICSGFESGNIDCDLFEAGLADLAPIFSEGLRDWEGEEEWRKG